jgi:hypothetical protein
MSKSLANLLRLWAALKRPLTRASDAITKVAFSMLTKRRLSTVVVQRFCKPKVAGSNPAAGTSFA